MPCVCNKPECPECQGPEPRPRIASKPTKAKRDRDAEFLRRQAVRLEKLAVITSWPGNEQRRKDARRLRRIAKRLEGT